MLKSLLVAGAVLFSTSAYAERPLTMPRYGTWSTPSICVTADQLQDKLIGDGYTPVFTGKNKFLPANIVRVWIHLDGRGGDPSITITTHTENGVNSCVVFQTFTGVTVNQRVIEELNQVE